MEFLSLTISMVVGLLQFVLILRVWFQFCDVDPYLPLSQLLMRLTNPLLMPLNNIMPTVKRVNIAAIIIAILIVVIEFSLFYSTIQIAVLIGLLSALKTFGKIMFFTTLIRALMSWVTQGNHPLDYVIEKITEPFLGLIRRILPRTGVLDFSVMVFGFILILLNNLLYNLFGNLWAIA